MKYNIKKEFDDQVKYYKGLMNQAYHTFLVPMVSEVNKVLQNVLKAEKTMLFLLNKAIFFKRSYKPIDLKDILVFMIKNGVFHHSQKFI